MTAGTSAISSPGFLPPQLVAAQAQPPRRDEAREVFDQFVGETFFGQMLASMRKTQGKPAYFHGGRAEEVFQGQLDQVLSEHLSQATAGSLSGPMYDLFALSRK